MLNKISYLFFSFRRMDRSLKMDEGNRGSYWSTVKSQFRRNRLARYSLRAVYIFVFLALFADFLAHDKPLIAKYDGRIYFPVLRNYLVSAGVANWQPEFSGINWKAFPFEWSIFPPVPFLPENLDNKNIHSVSPFSEQEVSSLQWRHWLGTDQLGRDVLSSMIHGTRIAVSVGLISMGIAAIIGIVLGSLAGYFGDEVLKITRSGLVLYPFFIFLAGFYAFYMRRYLLSDSLAASAWMFLAELMISLAIFCLLILPARLAEVPFRKLPYLGKQVNVPVDIIISRLIEVMISIPTLFLIISISAIIKKPSIYIVMIIIGCTSWTSIARFIRGELLRIRSLEFVEATRAMGFPEMRILFRHAIPNAVSPVLIAIAFGIAGAILVESTLSFLGIGVPPETLTWGSLLAAARQSPDAWWLAVFPGFAIFITVSMFNLLGEALTDAMDPRQRK